jgi:hypothetical protein
VPEQARSGLFWRLGFIQPRERAITQGRWPYTPTSLTCKISRVWEFELRTRGCYRTRAAGEKQEFVGLAGLRSVGLTLYPALTNHFLQQLLVDELGGRDWPLDFLGGTGKVDQELISVDTNFPVYAE